MKTIATLLLLFVSSTAYALDTLYYEASGIGTMAITAKGKTVKFKAESSFDFSVSADKSFYYYDSAYEIPGLILSQKKYKYTAYISLAETKGLMDDVSEQATDIAGITVFVFPKSLNITFTEKTNGSLIGTYSYVLSCYYYEPNYWANLTFTLPFSAVLTDYQSPEYVKHHSAPAEDSLEMISGIMIDAIVKGAVNFPNR